MRSLPLKELSVETYADTDGAYQPCANPGASYPAPSASTPEPLQLPQKQSIRPKAQLHIKQVQMLLECSWISLCKFERY